MGGLNPTQPESIALAVSMRPPSQRANRTLPGAAQMGCVSRDGPLGQSVGNPTTVGEVFSIAPCCARAAWTAVNARIKARQKLIERAWMVRVIPTFDATPRLARM